MEINDEISIHRQGKQVDLNETIPGIPILLLKTSFYFEFLSDPSPKPVRSTSRATTDKDPRLLPIPSSPKPFTTDMSKSLLTNTDERESPSNTPDPIYGNIQVLQRPKKNDISIEDEGDLIEHDLLNLVEAEQQRDSPPVLPIKKRAATIAAMLTAQDSKNNLDVNIEPTVKLVHPGKPRKVFRQNLFIFYVGKDRPRRANVRRPVKRSGNGTTNDSSSDGGLLTDENDDNSQGDITSEIQTPSSSVSMNPLPSELPAP